MYGKCQKKDLLKIEIKEETTEHVCSRKYVRFTQGTFHFESLCNSSKWSVIEPLGHNGNYQIWRPPGVDISRKRHQQVYSSFLRLSTPGFRSKERARMTATRHRLVEEVFTPGRIQARGRKEKGYKKEWSTQKGTWVKFFKVTIFEVKAGNCDNVKRFNIVVNLKIYTTLGYIVSLILLNLGHVFRFRKFKRISETI